MNNPSFRVPTVVAVAAVMWLLATPIADGQRRTLPEGVQTVGSASRTPWGDPDLQGIWTNTTTTPLERPAGRAGKELLTDAERLEADEQRARNADRPPRPGDPGAYNAFWLEPGRMSRQTSLIVDPPHGRLPFKVEAQKEAVARSDARFQRGTSPAITSWEDRDAYERCITRGMPGAMIPGYYNHNYQVVQTPGYVAIYVEMIHDVRIIPVDGRAHLTHNIRQWLGDSRGHWEGKTLVIETTNFNGKVKDRNIFAFGTGENARVVERFTRLDTDTIDYRVTVDDPAGFAKPWTASMPMSRLNTPLYEYACHEGNYGLEHILRAAREREKAADGAAVKR